jgi:polyhydroxyalkanoate synthesis regulator phasin
MTLIDTHKAIKQFTTAGIPEKQAEAITEVISNIDQQVATKSDIARLEDKIEANIERLEDKLDDHIKGCLLFSGAIFLLLLKLVFFGS